ncbi:response regulator transcription factor [Nitrospira sp. Kam-Ns4a]
MAAVKSVAYRAAKKRREVALPPRRKRPEALTSREQEILQLIWSGLKNKEIAQRLKISVKTVEAHRANMMKKVRVSNTAQLLKAAIQGGMIDVR